MDEGIRGRLRAGLTRAMKERDRVAVTALRSALGAVDNAEAVEDTVEAPTDGVIAKSVPGLGAGEAPRRQLSEDDVVATVRREIEDRRTAADEYRAAGRPDHADRLDAESAVLAGFL